jgi:polygalacturonase
MSGGARNIFVSDCTFIGTDIGLRFKRTRGRGGVVERIYIKNISMKDILGSAILFDMYYGGKSVLTGDGEMAADQTKYPLNEGTPQFKDFYVSNVVCNGAANGLLIRGLPEQAIKGIHLDNVLLRADKGAEISEAADVTLNRILVESAAPGAVISINNSENIKLDHLSYRKGTDLLLSITGAKSAQIQVTGTD